MANAGIQIKINKAVLSVSNSFIMIALKEITTDAAMTANLIFFIIRTVRSAFFIIS